MSQMTVDKANQARYLRIDLREKIATLKDVNELADYLQGVCDINTGKFKSLSKRRRKIFLTGLGDYFNVKKEEFVHRSKRHMKDVFFIPITHTCVEKAGKPMTDLLSAWAANLVEEE